MAAGLAIVAPEVGDIGFMVAEVNRPFLAARPDADLIAAGLSAFAADPVLRTTIGTDPPQR